MARLGEECEKGAERQAGRGVASPKGNRTRKPRKRHEGHEKGREDGKTEATEKIMEDTEG
jgi:hypothetical protein